MPPKSIPARPHIEHYKKQAKELLKRIKQGDPSSIERLKASHPKHSADPDNYQRHTLADAQMVIAREHGHATWADFARQIASITSQLLAEAQGPSHAFLIAASVPREGSYASGNVTQAEELLRQHPEVADASVFTAAVLGNTATVQRFLLADPSLATAEDGPYNWDALTYLCFSRYLRLDKQRSDGFVATARTLLDAGANANTGWWEENTGEDRAFWESAIYGAAVVAQHASLTRLLLEYGANPNDEETPYHIPETTDLSVLKVILDSRAMTDDSLTTMLLRKADWHDREGIRLLLEAGASPNRMTRWGNTALHQALRRDNALQTIELMLDHGADFSIITKKDGISAFALAARRGRGDVLRLLISRGIEPNLEGVDRLIAACALGDEIAVRSLTVKAPTLKEELLSQGGKLVAEFAGTANAEGMTLLLDLGVNVNARCEGDAYFDIAAESTALIVAAWKAWPRAVNVLIERGADVNARDARGRSALMMAVKACVDSYWKDRRSPEITRALLAAGASKEGVDTPCGYREVDALLSAIP